MHHVYLPLVGMEGGQQVQPIFLWHRYAVLSSIELACGLNTPAGTIKKDPSGDHAGLLKKEGTDSSANRA